MSVPARNLHPVADVIPFEPLVDKHAVATALDVSVSWVEKRCLDESDPLPSVKTKDGKRRFRVSVCRRWFEEG